jgi:hypothetical protein
MVINLSLDDIKNESPRLHQGYQYQSVDVNEVEDD